MPASQMGSVESPVKISVAASTKTTAYDKIQSLAHLIVRFFVPFSKALRTESEDSTADVFCFSSTLLAPVVSLTNIMI